jgi:hypothetical protein
LVSLTQFTTPRQESVLIYLRVGRRAVNVGDITGQGLYKAAKNYMEKECGSENKGWCDELGIWQTVYTHRISNFPNIMNSEPDLSQNSTHHY